MTSLTLLLNLVLTTSSLNMSLGCCSPEMSTLNSEASQHLMQFMLSDLQSFPTPAGLLSGVVIP